MAASLVRRLIAESLGTGLLVLFGAGSVVAALTVGQGTLDYAGLGMISLAFGIVVAVAIYAFGTTSGAHINPAVTVSLAATGRFPWGEVLPYILAQLVGAVVGAFLIVAVYGDEAASGTLVGATVLSSGVAYWQGIVAEALGTFLLLTAVMALAVDRRAPSGWAGLVIGLAVLGEILLIGPVSGGSVNPARTFGPYLAATISGAPVPWAQFGVYVVGPVLGGVLAALTYDALARPEGRPAWGRAARQGAEGEVVGEQEAVPPERA